MDKKIEEILENLTEREKKILEDRFGIDLKNDPDLSKAYKNLEITVEKIKQIEEKALKKLEDKNN